MAFAAGASLCRAAVLLLCALAGLLGAAEARPKSPPKGLRHRYGGDTSRGAGHKRFKREKPECAERFGMCKGNFSESKSPCCQNPADECKAFSKRLSACVPKPKPNGERCDTDEECANACVETACDLPDDDQDGQCPGVCDNLTGPPTLRRRGGPPRRRCTGGTRSLGKVCYRRGKPANCRGSRSRCVYEKRTVRNRKRERCSCGAHPRVAVATSTHGNLPNGTTTGNARFPVTHATRLPAG